MLKSLMEQKLDNTKENLVKTIFSFLGNLNNLYVQNNPPGDFLRWIKLIILSFFGCFES
mgnify:CR=1 FL=1